MDIQIRLGSKTDLRSIIEMSKGIYEGHDYLPIVFLRWLDEPNRRIIVAEKKGEVVGIRAFHIVDGGKTVLSQSLRVHPKYRGQGVSTVLIVAEQQYVKTHFPNVMLERYTTMSTNVGRLAIQRRSLGENLVLELGIIAFYVNSATFSISECANAQVRNISALQFQTLIAESRLNHVLQRDTLIIDWEPFKAVASNVSCGLANEDDCLLVTEHEASDRKNEIHCLSHGRMSPRVQCSHWVATIYSENFKLLTLHIAKQLEQATIQARQKKFIFSCFLPKCFVSEAKKYVLDEFSLEFVDFFNFNLLLFEKTSRD